MPHQHCHLDKLFPPSAPAAPAPLSHSTSTAPATHPIPPAPLVPPIPHAPPSPHASHVPPAPPIASVPPDVPLTAPPEEPPCPPLLLYRLIAALVRSFFQAHVGYYSDVVEKSIGKRTFPNR